LKFIHDPSTDRRREHSGTRHERGVALMLIRMNYLVCIALNFEEKLIVESKRPSDFHNSIRKIDTSLFM
jgi:hypothetical protein